MLIGHNGSGKTTFLRMAAGPARRRATAACSSTATPAGSLAARAALGYLSDSPTFYEDLSVWEHLEYVARMHGHEDWEQDAADLLGHLGLYDRADDLPTSFSRGLRQKAVDRHRPSSGRSTCCSSTSPSSASTPSGKAALMELLDEAARRRARRCSWPPTSSPSSSTVSRCVALRDGELIYDGASKGIDVLSLVS